MYYVLCTILLTLTLFAFLSRNSELFRNTIDHRCNLATGTFFKGELSNLGTPGMLYFFKSRGTLLLTLTLFAFLSQNSELFRNTIRDATWRLSSTGTFFKRETVQRLTPGSIFLKWSYYTEAFRLSVSAVRST
jgi:hypothetical protein